MKEAGFKTGGKDRYFMSRALRLAKKGEGSTSPNPLVGAVVVKDGEIIGQGFHKKAGLAHAETIALDKAGAKARGAVLYVSLEPCCSFGRTPPCVDRIIQARIKRVVVAAIDPSPEVSGKSIGKLKKHKIQVSTGICAGAAEKMNEVFFKNIKTGLPFVAAKIAQSLDGKIATAAGRSKWITQEKTRDFSRSLRDKYDAVLIGANTLKADNPGLNGLKKNPCKIILSFRLNLPRDSYIMKNYADNSIVFTSPKAKNKNKSFIQPKVCSARETKKGLSLKEILSKLYRMGIMSVFVEGGSHTLGRFFEQNLVDKIYFFLAPRILGGDKALTSVGGSGFRSPGKSILIKDIRIKRIGRDFLFSGYPEADFCPRGRNRDWGNRGR